ncbi:MAG: hypothetical protein PHQ60_02355 [Sideroxydans sp.]|nr:hypothetical protein [Sideroxydans sp.]MDD5056686.1 hypothetical protein [Sideroxydans sp.]
MKKPDETKLIFSEKKRSQKPKPGTANEPVAKPQQVVEPETKARVHTAESGYGADPGVEHWKSCADEVSGFVLVFNDELINRLREIDKNIVKYGKLLNDSQPGSSGKILVRWWKVGARGRAGGSTPVFMVLYRNRAGKLSGKRIEKKNITKKARSTSTFSINYELTKEILATLANLYEMREKLFFELGRFKRVSSALKAKESNIHYIAARSAALSKQISKNLYGSDEAIT